MTVHETAPQCYRFYEDRWGRAFYVQDGDPIDGAEPVNPRARWMPR